MTYWAIAWLAWSCPGDGALWGRLVPRAALLRVGACVAKPEMILEANRAAAIKKATAQGPGVRLFKYDGLRRREVPVKWENKMSMEE